jgi:biotin carboxylase
MQVVMDAPSAAVVARCNRKHEMRELAAGFGVPVADGELIALDGPPARLPRDLRPLESAVRRVLSRGARVIVRASEAAGGSGTFLMDPGTDALESTLAAVSKRRDNRFYLVEERVDACVSPNLMLYLPPPPAPIRCLGVTDQVLDGELVHRGNRFPAQARLARAMERDALRLARALRGEGYRGLAGFDFLEWEPRPSSGRRYFFVELNPRVNGAFYPLATRARLNGMQERCGRPLINAFLSRALRTRPMSFQTLTELTRDLFFDPERGSGVLPYKTGGLRFGIVTSVALAASAEAADGMMSEFASRLPKAEEPG